MKPMNELKHTPGPWFVHDFSGLTPNEPPKPTDVSVSCTSPDHLGVARMDKALCNSYEEALANAHLMKTAPEMFYELQDIVDMANMNPNGSANVFLSARDMQSIQMILKKAKGKDQ